MVAGNNTSSWFTVGVDALPVGAEQLPGVRVDVLHLQPSVGVSGWGAIAGIIKVIVGIIWV